MVKIFRSVVVFTVGLLCLAGFSTICRAKTIKIVPSSDSMVISQSDKVQQTDTLPDGQYRECLFPGKSRSLALSHFTWGAEAGSSLDLTSHDLSTFDIDVLLGYKNSFIMMAGIGAGIHRSIHSGNNFIPVYAVVRTNFRNRPSLFFFNFQAGYSFNTLSDSGTVGDFYGALGLGINLQQTRMSKTYVILSGSYQYFSEDSKIKTDLDSNYIFFAKLVIGVNF